MIQSQHEDLQTEYGRIKNQQEEDAELHRKEDEERDAEYKQFKQEKELEISSLKGNIYTQTTRPTMNSFLLMIFITQWTSVSSAYLYLSCNEVCDLSSNLNCAKT